MAERCLVYGYTISLLTQTGTFCSVAVAPFCRVIVDSYGHECVTPHLNDLFRRIGRAIWPDMAIPCDLVRSGAIWCNLARCTSMLSSPAAGEPID
eukprot:6518888-Prymnesium_polylepis.2